MNPRFLLKVCFLFSFTFCVHASASQPPAKTNPPATTNAESNVGSPATNSMQDKGVTLPAGSPATTDSSTNSVPATITLSADEFDKLLKASKEQKSDEDPYRGHYVDVSAALFGWLAVIFAIATLVIGAIAVGFSLFGIYKFRDLTRKVERELKENVEKEFRTSLQTVIRDEITPKIKQISDVELIDALEQVKVRAGLELKKVVEGLDSREVLINEVVTVIQNRLSPPPPLNQQEFEGNA